ncbi:MAG: ACT domain-containing protein, partial [Eggerthellaceae bacterium]
VKMDVSVSADSRGYDSIVSMEADGLEISATVPGSLHETHIVSILRYRLDVVPADYALVFLYPDEPGQIGRIGTILGEEGINISTMAIGKRTDCKEVLVFLNVESEASKDVVDRVAAAIDANRAWSIRL